MHSRHYQVIISLSILTQQEITEVFGDDVISNDEDATSDYHPLSQTDIESETDIENSDDDALGSEDHILNTYSECLRKENNKKKYQCGNKTNTLYLEQCMATCQDLDDNIMLDGYNVMVTDGDVTITLMKNIRWICMGIVKKILKK